MSQHSEENFHDAWLDAAADPCHLIDSDFITYFKDVNYSDPNNPDECILHFEKGGLVSSPFLSGL